MMDCKKALQEFDGDMEAATEALRAKHPGKSPRFSARLLRSMLCSKFKYVGFTNFIL